MKKDLNEAPVNKFREIYAYYYQQQKDIDELSERVNQNPDVLEVLDKTPPWSYFYELPYVTFLAICILVFELTEPLRIIASESDPVQAFLDHIDNLPDLAKDDEPLTQEEKGIVFSLVMALIGQISSIAIHGQPLSTLIQQARESDDESLFNAVLVDRSVVSAPSVAHRIQIAQLTNDETFMNLLAKAITQTKPRRPAKELDDLRYMLEVIDENIGLKNISHSKLYDILSDDLELYSGSTDGLMRLIQRRNMSRT